MHHRKIILLASLAMISLSFLEASHAQGKRKLGGGKAVPPPSNVLKVEYYLSDLDARDKLQKDAFVRSYKFLMTEGRGYTISLKAGFAGRLRLETPGGEVLAKDDAAEKRDATIRYKATTSGHHVILVTSVKPGASGAFTLTARDNEVPDVVTKPPVKTDPPATKLSVGKLLKKGQTLEADDELTPKDAFGSPRKGAYCKVYALPLKANEKVRIDMMSTAFDSYLYVRDKDQKELASDDDGGAGNNARIIFTAPSDGEYQILATTFGASTAGKFRLTVQPE